MARKPKRAHSWPDQVRWDLEFAKRTILESGECRPIFTIYTKDQIIPVGSAVGRDDKQAFYNLLTCMCIANDAIALGFHAEAWMRSLANIPGESKDESLARANAVMPSEAEDRIEVVIAQISYRDEGGKHLLWRSAEIERDWNGKVSGFSDRRLGDGSEIKEDQGMISRILPDQPPTSQQIELARQALPMLATLLGFNLQTINLEGGNA